MKTSILLSIALFMGMASGVAQQKISGKVHDQGTGESLPGVNIYVKGTALGTVTDQSGNFEMKLGSGIDSIQVSFVGYKTKTLPVASSLNISMEPSWSVLNTVIVSANREWQPRTEAPVSIHSISWATLQETKATGLELLLNKTPGVYMVDLGNEQHSMSVRQPLSTKNMYLYLEDGIPIRTTGDFNHNALIEINQASLNKIEVIKGPASSLYGSEAVGGAVNFITQAPSAVPMARVRVEKGNFGYLRSDFSLSNTYKKVGIYTGGYVARRVQSDNLHNDFQKLAFNLRADYSISKKGKWVNTLAFIDYFTDQKGALDSLHFYSKDYSSVQRFTYRKVNTLRVKSSYIQQWNERNTTQFSVFYRDVSVGQNPFYAIRSVKNNPLKARGEINVDAFNSYGAIVQHTKKFKFIPAQIIGGLSMDDSPNLYKARFISIDKDAQGINYAYTDSDSLLTDYRVNLLNLAAYTQVDINPFPKLKVVLAARYDRLNYAFDNHLAPSAYTGAPDKKDYFGHFTPKIGVTYDFGKDRGAYLNYSVGFAPPNISDLYRGVKVPYLKPATFSNYEMGGWLSFASDKGYVEMSLYEMDGVNEIISVRLPDGSYENQNTGKTRHKGIESSIRYAPLNGLMVRIGGTMARHEYVDYVEKGTDYSGHCMAQAPAFVANGELMYKPSFVKGLRIGVELQSLGSYFMDAKNSQEYKGFTIMNVRTGYTLHGIELWVNVINLTDAVYATSVDKSGTAVNYRPGQLRTINVGLGYQYNKNKD